MVRQEYQLSAVPSRLQPGPDKNLYIGSWLLSQGFAEEAEPWLENAVSKDQNSVPAVLNLGISCRQTGQFKRAEYLIEDAIKMDGQCSAAWANLGMLREDIGQFEAATNAYKDAYSQNARNPTIALNYAMCLLRNGEWEKAWPLWEFGRQPDLRLSNVPRWTGAEDGHGKSLLIVPEGGYGDLIWLMRYFPMLKEHGFKIHLWTWDSLVPLLEKHKWIDEVIPASQGVQLVEEVKIGGAFTDSLDKQPTMQLRYDYQIPLMSIPAVLGIQEARPIDPYISAEGPWGVPPAKITPLTLANKRIGIAWKAEENYTARKHRSLPDEVATKLQLAGITWVSLVPEEGFGNISIPLMKEMNWLETARIMHPLDLVISCDTAVLHLAGSMGVPTWALLPMRSDWKWGLPEKRFEWYPNMRVFQQTDPISWQNVVEEVCQALKEL